MNRKSARGEKENAVARATLRHVRLSPQKARLVLNLIRGKQVGPALQMLDFSPKKGAKLVAKLLRSAVTSAKEQQAVDVDALWVTGGWVGMGRTIKRYMPRARGAASPIRKRSSHITVVVGEL